MSKSIHWSDTQDTLEVFNITDGTSVVFLAVLWNRKHSSNVDSCVDVESKVWTEVPDDGCGIRSIRDSLATI